MTARIDKGLRLSIYSFRAESRGYYKMKTLFVVSYSKEMAMQDVRIAHKREHWEITYLQTDEIKKGLVFSEYY